MRENSARAVVVSVAVVLMLSSACGAQAPEPPPVEKAKEDQMAAQPTGFAITSPAFVEGEPIPARYTADGADVSPPLAVASVPEGTSSLALIMDDPDAPVGLWVHWVVWNLPPDSAEIAEGVLPEGALSGRNSWRRTGYGGPAPPSGVHRYFFKVYALDTTLDLPGSADKAALERAMEGHVLAQAQVMGTYTRER